MKRVLLALVTVTAGLLLGGVPDRAMAQADLFEQPAVEGVEELTRGPIHEAFANPVTDDTDSRLVVPKQPPEPIAEEPAELRPEGDGVVWIPGYWAWDAEREDFIWISGVWRALIRRKAVDSISKRMPDLPVVATGARGSRRHRIDDRMG